MTQTVNVGLGERSYPIMIEEGLLARIGADARRREVGKRWVVVSDDNVAAFYGDTVMAALREADLQPELVRFPAGEESKTLATIADLAGRLARLGVDRKDCLLALGGGVTGDITGFLAASYMRGINFVQVPTSLLAQVDSSVGGKTGVDIPEGKNLVGAFYQPKAVYIDGTVLATLPRPELLNGIAEVIKYGVIWDADFFAWLEQNRAAILDLDLPVLEHLIATCCAIKAEVVAKDEREADLRRILNFGHTIGHAVEADSGYRLPHGAAVAIGMVAAGKIACAKGLWSREDHERMTALISAFGLPTAIPAGSDPERLRAYLLTDKKTVGGRPFFVLPERIGAVTITDEVAPELIDDVLTP